MAEIMASFDVRVITGHYVAPQRAAEENSATPSKTKETRISRVSLKTKN